MNLCRSTLSWIYTIFAINTINSAFCYEPVFVIEWSDGDYSFPSDAKYDHEKYHYITLAPRGQKISLLCTQNGIPGSYTVLKTETNEVIVDETSCEWPFVWRIFKSKAHNKIGIAIHTPSKKSSTEYENLAEDFKVLGLIGFVFDKSRGRTELVWYNLTPGYLLHAEIYDQDAEEGEIEEKEEFENNKEFYGYDINAIYTHFSSQFAKVPLAPEQDFLYPNHKAATRYNVLTAPMWPELQPQWQALEIFTRKVAQVLSFLSIRVGVHGSIMKPGTSTQPASPVFLNSEKAMYPIPQYFYKVVIFRFVSKNGNQGEKEEEDEEAVHRFGILFVMHNSRLISLTESNYELICPEDQTKIAETGWMNFLPASKLKSPMYACLYNETNMRKFRKQLYKKFDVFNLNDLPTLAVDPETGKEFIKNKNILNEMKAWEEAIKNNTQVKSNETLMQAYELFQGDPKRQHDIPLEFAEEDSLQHNTSGLIPPGSSQEDKPRRKRRRRWSRWDLSN